MKNPKFLTLLLLSLFFVNAFSQAPINVNETYRLKLDQPVTAEWLKARFKNETPLLMLSSSRLTQIKTAVKNDSTVNKLYRIYKRDADYLCASKPQGKGNSIVASNREAIYRNTTLALVALVESDNKKYINRLNDELLALCAKTQFTNPLDRTERAFAMAVGMSWGKNWLPKTTVSLVKNTLADDFLQPSLELAKQNKGSVERSNNWELVCNSGLMAAAIVTADLNPKLSAEVISRSLDKLPMALDAEYPQIAHLEDNMSRNYGSIYTIYALEMCRETFGTDFGFSKSPGFMEAPLLDLISISPTGQTFDFYEDKLNNSHERFSVFSWFDTQLQRPHYFDRVAYNERLKARLNGAAWNIVDRYEPLSILWLVENKYSKNKMILPEKYFGKGLNPVVVMRSKTDAHGFYFAAKGGKSNTSQGKMDAGSFVYELDGVRWAINLDLQHTEAAEKAMGNELWNFTQTAKRWELLSLNNFGHNTLTVNGQLFDVDAFSDVYESGKNDAMIDLTKQYFENVVSAKRTLSRINATNVQITDNIQPNLATKEVVWAMHTTADATIEGNVVHLVQDGKKCDLAVHVPSFAVIRIVNLENPSLPYDLHIKGLKRIEIVQKNRFRAPMEFKVELGSNIPTPKQIKGNMEDWASFWKYEKANQRITQTPKVVFMGNSITQNWWKNDSLFFKNNNYANRGISGQTSSQMLVRFRADVLNLKPKAVVILSGTNDIARNGGYISLENVFGNIVSMVELAQANHIRPILCSLLPTFNYWWIWPDIKPAGEIIKLNIRLKEYAQKNNLTYVDYYSALVDERGGLPDKYTEDGIHPIDAGYKVMVSIIKPVLDKVK